MTRAGQESASSTRTRARTRGGESDTGIARSELWRVLVAASDDIDELSRRYDLLDEDGQLPQAELPTRTSARPRETKWREWPRLDAGELERVEKPGTSAEDDRKALEPLKGAVHACFDELLTQLEGLEGANSAERASLARVEQALRIHFDERVLERIPKYLRSSWTRLNQRSNNGGLEFYRFVDEDLVDRGSPSLVFEIYCYCLTHDFVGRYANDPAAIAQYRHNVEGRVHIVELDAYEAPEPEAQATREPWPTQRYYIVALAAAALFTVLLTLATNHLPASSRESEHDAPAAAEDKRLRQCEQEGSV